MAPRDVVANIVEQLSSYAERPFALGESESDPRTEIIAGITIFLTTIHIFFVQPELLTGIPGEKPGIVLEGYSYLETKQIVTIVVVLAAAVSTLIMAFYADMPFAQAPGSGLAAFFAFTVVGAMGVPWQTALAAVFVEGIIFILLTVVGARKYIINLIPEGVRFATGTGIGLFLLIIGLQGMHVVVDHPSNMVGLGNIAQDPVAIVATLGLLFTLMLRGSGLRGSYVLGIVATAIVAWIATFLNIVQPGVLVPEALPGVTYDISPLVGAFSAGFDHVGAVSFALIVFTFFFVDFFDTAGTLTATAQVAGYLDENGTFPDIDKPLLGDAVGTTFGSMIGSSTVTTFIQSAIGAEEGGRTGLTPLTTASLYLGALLFIPLAAAVPVYAARMGLVVTGLVMMANVVEVDWDHPAHALPAALTIVLMPLTYSIAYGIAAGIIAYPMIKIGAGEWRDIRVGQWILAGVFVLYFVVRTSGIGV